MELGLLLTLGGIGAAFWIPALVMFSITMGRKITCTAKAEAYVTGIKTKAPQTAAAIIQSMNTMWMVCIIKKWGLTFPAVCQKPAP